MSIQAITLVLDFSPAHWNVGTRLIAVALADRVGQDWKAWPSIDDICQRTGLKKRMVQYHIAYLEAEGVIAREARWRDNGSQASNLWIWLWRMTIGPDGQVHATAPGGSTGLHPTP